MPCDKIFNSATSLRATVGRAGRSPYRDQAATAKRTGRVSNNIPPTCGRFCQTRQRLVIRCLHLPCWRLESDSSVPNQAIQIC